MRTPDDIYDEWLVLRCQSRDSGALAELVDRWQPRLVRQALRLTGQADAAGDIAQSAWLAIFQGLNRLDDPACFRRWAYQITTHKCADWVRSRQQARAITVPLWCEPMDGNSPIEDLQDDVAMLRQALKGLSAEHRAVLSMHYLDEMPLAEIAASLSLSIGTVKSRLHYARANLKRILERSERHGESIHEHRRQNP